MNLLLAPCTLGCREFEGIPPDHPTQIADCNYWRTDSRGVSSMERAYSKYGVVFRSKWVTKDCRSRHIYTGVRMGDGNWSGSAISSESQAHTTCIRQSDDRLLQPTVRLSNLTSSMQTVHLMSIDIPTNSGNEQIISG